VSKVVSPYPVLLNDPDRDHKPDPMACWWRLRLVPNEHGHLMYVETDAKDGDMTTATWCSWEFYDGESTILDAGMDSIKVDGVRIVWRHHDIEFIDILCAGQPTPSPRWRQLTLPGDFEHPEDRSFETFPVLNPCPRPE
jgi:hypothetical protein